MIRATLLTIALAAPAYTATVSTWSGRTANACDGRCPMEWAETHLTAAERSDLEEARAKQPEPLFVPIYDGSMFTLVTYFKDGKPRAYRTTTIATLKEATTSSGWVMDGWSWVKLDDCQNWTKVLHGAGGVSDSPYAVASSDPVTTTHGGTSSRNTGGYGGGTGGFGGDTIYITNTSTTPQGPSPVPLPATGLMLLAGLFGFIGWRKK